MSNYFYSLLLFVGFAYVMIHSIYLFNHGKYNPYLFGKASKETNKQRLFNFGLYITFMWSLYNLLLNTKPPFFAY